MPYFRWIKQWWSVLIESRLKQWAGSLKKKVPGSPFPIQLEQESITLQKDFQTKTDFFRIHFVQVHCQPCWQEWSLQKRVKNLSWFATFGLFCATVRNLSAWQLDERRHLASASDSDRVVIWILQPSDPVALLYQPYFQWASQRGLDTWKIQKKQARQTWAEVLMLYFSFWLQFFSYKSGSPCPNPNF